MKYFCEQNDLLMKVIIFSSTYLFSSISDEENVFFFKDCASDECTCSGHIKIDKWPICSHSESVGFKLLKRYLN